ncbi:MAG: GTPase Era [Alphaproteobacteria bacterium]|nr:GTPase Era [Alphaproteobacteria bacterium]
MTKNQVNPTKKNPARPAKTRAGFVAILGAPNAGKSTLLNRLIGQKVSIVSPKAQTTRMRTLGIMSEGDVQISFIDTPGIFAPKRRLDRAMVRAAWDSLEDADAVVLLVDAAARKENEKIAAIIDELRQRFSKTNEKEKRPSPLRGEVGEEGSPAKAMFEMTNIASSPLPPPPAPSLKGRGRKLPAVILALNKVDAVVPGKLLSQTAELNDAGIFSDVFMISALTGDGVEDLKKHLKSLMPESPWYYGEDQVSDLPSPILAAEMTREQLYRQLQQELPYAAAVLPESLEEKRDGSVVIRQTIVVARANHRPIVLGKNGVRIKSIGEKARAEIARLFDRKVHLFLEVKADEKWQDRPDFYSAFGLDYGKK